MDQYFPYFHFKMQVALGISLQASNFLGHHHPCRSVYTKDLRQTNHIPDEVPGGCARRTLNDMNSLHEIHRPPRASVLLRRALIVSSSVAVLQTSSFCLSLIIRANWSPSWLSLHQFLFSDCEFFRPEINQNIFLQYI